MWTIFEEYKNRLNACYSCDAFKDEKCTHCGCYMKAKAVLPFTKCPEDRWDSNPKTQKDRPEWFK